MTDKKRIDEGYSPSRVKKGYQPQKPSTPKPDGGEVTGGYQPPTSEGDNPGNKPPPKKP